VTLKRKKERGEVRFRLLPFKLGLPSESDHPIRLDHNQHIHPHVLDEVDDQDSLLETDSSIVHQIQNSTGSSNDDFQPLLPQKRDLLPLRHSSEKTDGLVSEKSAEGGEGSGGLEGELSSWGDDEDGRRGDGSSTGSLGEGEEVLHGGDLRNEGRTMWAERVSWSSR